ncbi:unnamed protein product [Tetraodon nigroviridis]|uniref:(spotted green pufferfish) hypothetical protein n=1 Tax=Tetraodon nigroviridis TaxID=99883 RepID=Q4RJT8_TETNG|nr:unnamed protein product [Tetraodon nigroviridis]
MGASPAACTHPALPWNGPARAGGHVDLLWADLSQLWDLLAVGGMVDAPLTTPSQHADLPYQCASVDYLCSPRLVKKGPAGRPCHDRPAIKPRPQPSASPRPPIAQKPQVPPKPAHLLALGQDKKPKRIPPAPSRPLPTPPPPPKPKPSPTSPGSAAQPQKEAQKVGLLIERFENSRYFTADFWSVRFLPFYYSVSLNTAQSCLGMSQR